MLTSGNMVAGSVIWTSTTNIYRGRVNDILTKYAFVMDRLLAIRQEIVSESMVGRYPADSTAILKAIICFYIHSMMTMCAAHHPTISASATNSVSGASHLFGLHLHENTLSSCFSTAIQNCQDLVNSTNGGVPCPAYS